MYPHRTRFGSKKEIITEFLPPRRIGKRTRILIALDGAPTVPSKRSVFEHFTKLGYWVFHPRYRGTWESDGSFLAKSPHEDVLAVLDGIEKPFSDISYSRTRFPALKLDTVVLFANSFGGPAAFLASRDPRVTHVIAISPVVDWKAKSKAEPLSVFFRVIRDAFGSAYRGKKADWAKLNTGRFYNPARHVHEFDGRKFFIIHAKDDDVVLPGPVAKFAKQTKAELVMLSKGGHLSSSVILKQVRLSRLVKRFLNKR